MDYFRITKRCIRCRKPLRADEQIAKEEYESMQNECINNLNVAMLRNDAKAVASVRQDYADLQDYYGED